MQDRLPISLCVIVKDDPLLEGCLRSVRDYVKEIVVVRTAKDPGDLHRLGSLIDVLSYGDEFIDPEIEEFSCCRARKKTRELATQPWWMWLDSDDRMRDPARLVPLLEHAQASLEHGTISYFEFSYEYAYAHIRSDKFSDNHDHEIFVTTGKPAAFDADIYVTSFVVGHSHKILLTSEQVQQVRRGDKITVKPTENNGHFHVFNGFGKSEDIVFLKRERLFHNPKKWHWLYPIHEVMVVKSGENSRKFCVDTPVVEHHRTADSVGEKSARNLRIMKKYVEKHPDDLRCMFYYGTELLAARKNEDAKAVLSRYIELGNWDDERAVAWLKLVDLNISTGQYWGALPWALKTISVKENWQEGYFALARVFYLLGTQGGAQEMRHWERCAFFCEKGLELPDTQTVLHINPLEGRHFVYEWLSYAVLKMGDFEVARHAAQKGLESSPPGTLELD